jgi:hypothetical protein
MELEESCGAELSRDAEVPQKLGQLMAHVAHNLRAHAEWVGTETVEAKLEHDALQQVATGYDAISQAAERTAATMAALRTLAPAPHDPQKHDRTAFADWMREKIAKQRELARLLLEHAASSEKVLKG